MFKIPFISWTLIVCLRYQIHFTGTHMHVDPLSTDAFNALFRGHKWWVYLPSDIYEFDDELTCDETCSDLNTYEGIHIKSSIRNSLMANQKNSLWFAHILPQLR